MLIVVRALDEPAEVVCGQGESHILRTGKLN